MKSRNRNRIFSRKEKSPQLCRQAPLQVYFNDVKVNKTHALAPGTCSPRVHSQGCASSVQPHCFRASLPPGSSWHLQSIGFIHFKYSLRYPLGLSHLPGCPSISSERYCFFFLGDMFTKLHGFTWLASILFFP